ncbi:MAG: hypothetical protein KIT11_04345 [Fimbriimonadaceae bacterium]|nr:hypothetical protein [Fimbriimonadaceae bacterium]QYK56874.1 MAG: hypothetical protein KF733_05180 [Fimbriimonadaceae bacterium]
MTSQTLTSRAVWAVYLPLALSWLLMAVEGPVTMSYINRLPDPTVNMAAFQPLFALALFLESPVIDLLSTATTLVRGRATYGAIRRFTLLLMLWTGAAHALVALTPLYDVIAYGVLALKPEVAEAARLPMAIMIPWSPAIGWRRHLQGVLIRSGITRMIGFGTMVRLVTITAVGLGMLASRQFTGIVVAAGALTAAVIAEALFIHWAARPALRQLAQQKDPDDAVELDMRALTAFHLPLTGATMIQIATGPLISGALSRLPDGVHALSAWQNSTGLGFLMRTLTFALPEVVIRFYHDKGAEPVLRRFCTQIGAAMTGLTLLLCVTGLDILFLRHVQGTPEADVQGAHLAIFLTAILPLLYSAVAFVRGGLTAMRLTKVRLTSTVASLLTMALLLAIGVAASMPGVLVAAIAVLAAQFAELSVLFGAWSRTKVKAAPV